MEKNNAIKQIQLINIGGSAGSLNELLKIFTHIKPGFSIPFLIVLHRNSIADNILEKLIANKTTLKVKEVEEKERIKNGHVYICPPDYHVLIEKDKTFSLDYSEKINYSRPSIDVVFHSAANVFGNTAMGILLSGANADGAEGLAAISDNGGITIVQSPDEAQVAVMPKQAVLFKQPNHIFTIAAVIDFLNKLKA
jgi:two-component system, chemotaxis family, protein-glutamate methylesterase/glutaminase